MSGHALTSTMDDAQAVALLAWYVAAGADEAVLDAPVNRLLPPAPLSEIPEMPARPAVITPTAGKLRGTTEAAQSAEALARAATDLHQLEQALRAFDGCALKNTAMNTVFADGDPASGLMFVGEAPGADEDRQGRPFVGVSGQLLDRILAAIGRDRRHAYIANILAWRPPGNRKPTPQEILICLPFIKRHIALVRPKVLVFLGGVPAGSLLDTNTGIMRLRGRWMDYEDPAEGLSIPAMPTFHPSYLLRQPERKGDAWRDFLEVAARIGAP